MPFGDGTGPNGQGPMTGRGLGFCAGYNSPGYTKGIPGRGRGFGWRKGAGFGWRFFGWRANSQRVQGTPSARISKEEEKELVQEEIEALEEELKNLKKRLKELD